MPMTTALTLRYEGPPACVDCQRNGISECAHNGFNPEAWEPMIDQNIDMSGLDSAHVHTLRSYDISADRKTITLTVDTERPRFHDLARHLSTRSDVRAKAAVRAIHHETGDTLEEGYYDRFLSPGEQVCIDRDLYHVQRIEHPHRDPKTGVAHGVDWQVAHLAPIPVEDIRPIETTRTGETDG